MSAAQNLSKEEAYKQDVKGYLTGFAAAVVLTVIPFAMVAIGGFGTGTVLGAIAILGLIQVVVHVRYFLHVDMSEAHQEERHLLAFSVLLLFIMAAGTVWVLVNMGNRMMPGMPGVSTSAPASTTGSTAGATTGG